MKTLVKSLKRQDGFTLVELMVVVAIIGLLSAVAIPNFKKYQAKAKMSEAKLQLSAAYTAEAAFFSDFNMYAACLGYMGYDPSNEKASRYYVVGFKTTTAVHGDTHLSAVNSGLLATACPTTVTAADGSTFFSAGKGVGSAIAIDATFLPASTNGTQEDNTNMTFTIGTGGIIDGDKITTANCSQLTISERKVIAVVRPGY